MTTLTTIHVAKSIEIVTRRPLPRDIDFNHDTRFDDLGLDNLHMAEIAMDIEASTQTSISVEAESAETVGEFLRIVNSGSEDAE